MVWTLEWPAWFARSAMVYPFSKALEQKKWRRVCGVMDSEYSLKIRLTWLRVRWLSPRPGNR